ncbi:hypothetical protein G6F50_016353 [Rhizopus delemar]|uniref:Uncharacterized protein n=1 Tax=Rhizopus delemar TaxID=936053 RepID=A0A9P6XTM7_9FUNG|nr:hypothetical protein G6F50_016353 [Rhizopus delemar]
MAGGADAGVGQRALVLVLFDVFGQFLDVVGREVRARDDGHGHVDDQADGLKALVRVVAGVLVQRRRGREAGVHQQDGIAVRLGAGDLRRADGAAGTPLVFDHSRLAQTRPHGFRQRAGDVVGRAACSEWHHHIDGALRIFRVGGAGREHGAGREQGRKRAGN